jgi:hypothetical protein
MIDGLLSSVTIEQTSDTTGSISTPNFDTAVVQLLAVTQMMASGGPTPAGF